MTVSLNSGDLLSGNGINVATTVDQIISKQSGPITAWQTQLAALSGQENALTGLQTDLANLTTTIHQLTDPLGALAAQTAASSNVSVLSATAQTSAIAGTHEIVVDGLASSGTVYTDPIANDSTSILSSGQTSGVIQLQIGGASGATHDFAITAGSNDTLATLATYINQQNLGVNASVVSDAKGARLAIYSQSTGTPGALAIASNNSNLNFNAPIGGTNAQLTIDGIPISSTSNTLSTAIQGVTLSLVGSDPGKTVQLTVGSDAAGAKQAINDFVSSYNALVADINTQYAINPSTQTEGPLGADGSVRSLQASILGDAGFSVTGNSGGLVNLASLGINLQNDGTLKVDDTQLNSTLNTNPAAAQSFFQAPGTGFASHLSTDLKNISDSVTGIINSDIKQNTSQQTTLNDSITKFQDQLTAQRVQLTKVYSLLNATLESYPSLLLEINTQLGTATTTSQYGSKQ